MYSHQKEGNSIHELKKVKLTIAVVFMLLVEGVFAKMMVLNGLSGKILIQAKITRLMVMSK